MKIINMKYWQFCSDLLQSDEDCLKQSPVQLSLIMRKMLDSPRPDLEAEELAGVATLAQEETGLKSINY